MTEFCIQLIGDRRSDGSVCVSSNDLPMFCVVGEDDRTALGLALSLLPEYLKANVPEFVDLRAVHNATAFFSSKEEQVLPTHVIARTNKERTSVGREAEPSFT